MFHRISQQHNISHNFIYNFRKCGKNHTFSIFNHHFDIELSQNDICLLHYTCSLKFTTSYIFLGTELKFTTSYIFLGTETVIEDYYNRS